MVNQEFQFLRQRNEQLEKAFAAASQLLKQQYKLWSNSRLTGALFSKAQHEEGWTRKIYSQYRAQLLPTTEQFISSVIDMLPAAVFVKDARDLRFILWNRAAEKLVGVSAEEILGKSDYDLFPKEEADFFTKRDREVLNSKQETSCKSRLG